MIRNRLYYYSTAHIPVQHNTKQTNHMTRRHRYQSPSRQRCDAFRILIAVSACFLLGVVVAAMPDYMYAGKTTAVKEYVPRLKDPRLLFMNIKAPRVVEFYSPTCVSFRCLVFDIYIREACMAFRKRTIYLFPIGNNTDFVLFHFDHLK